VQVDRIQERQKIKSGCSLLIHRQAKLRAFDRQMGGAAVRPDVDRYIARERP